MTVSSIPCPICGVDRKFFSQPDGKSIKGNCGHVIENAPEEKRKREWLILLDKSRAKGTKRAAGK